MMLAIYGPTVTGKTALSIKLAKKINGEIISCDSRQVYTELDIGSGKIDPKSNFVKESGYWLVDGVKIYGFDILPPGSPFTVADFVHYAQKKISKIKKSQKIPIVSGGTGFYLKSLIYGLGTYGIQKNPALRKNLEKLSKEELYKKLFSINRTKALSMNVSDKNNPRRLIRAIEIFKSKKVPHSVQNTTENFLILGLTGPNDYLFKKADKWLKERIASGLIEEVENLLQKGVNPIWLDSLGLEYRWITRILQKKISRDEGLKKLQGDIHDLIRRQKTWFKQFRNIRMFDVSQKGWQEELEKGIEKFFDHAGQKSEKSLH